MKYLILFTIALVGYLSIAAPNVTNTVLMVDQKGELNVEGVASVEDIAKNSVKVQIAEAKAQAAQDTARGVTNAIQGVIANIMDNNVIVYRRGFSDSFAPLVIYTDNDHLVIAEARWKERSAEKLVVEIDYCCTADLGSMKPIVMHRHSIEGSNDVKHDFGEVPEANVTVPIYTEREKKIGDHTFKGYYTLTATIDNPASIGSYFLWIKVDGDAPGGDGSTLDLPNGVTGGKTVHFIWGDRELYFTGGICTGVK